MHRTRRTTVPIRSHPERPVPPVWRFRDWAMI
jgi:hypothetical protein